VLGPNGSQPRGFAPSSSPLQRSDVAAESLPGSPLGFVPLQGSLQLDFAPTPPAEARCAAGTAATSTVSRRTLLVSLESLGFHRVPKNTALSVLTNPAAVRRPPQHCSPFDRPLMNFRLLSLLHRSVLASTGQSFRDLSVNLLAFLLLSPGLCRCLHRSASTNSPAESATPPKWCTTATEPKSCSTATSPPKRWSHHPAHGPSLSTAPKCDRKTAFPAGRSQPGLPSTPKCG